MSLAGPEQRPPRYVQAWDRCLRYRGIVPPLCSIDDNASLCYYETEITDGDSD